MEEFKHVPVLLSEVLAGLAIKPDGIYVDCTLGGAGHAQEILKRIPDGHLYCFDQDDYAIGRSNLALSKIGSNYTIIKANFSHLAAELARLAVKKVDGILYDLGVSSFQLDIPERGFSYKYDAPLDMRMDPSIKTTAHTIVNWYDEAELAKILAEYGEERYAPLIARSICKRRSVRAIDSTLDLAQVVKNALPARVLRKEKHPAKKTFQALRIAVNDELRVLGESLKQAATLLNPAGRLCVISFHSLEDRLVKQYFKTLSSSKMPKDLPLKASEEHVAFKLVTRKPLTASQQELQRNWRAHSGKLRIIQKEKEE